MLETSNIFFGPLSLRLPPLGGVSARLRAPTVRKNPSLGGNPPLIFFFGSWAAPRPRNVGRPGAARRLGLLRCKIFFIILFLFISLLCLLIYINIYQQTGLRPTFIL